MRDTLTPHFLPVSLADLNTKAEMLTRLDNKYVVPVDVLETLVPALAAHFDILEIDGKRRFGYQTCYFDSPCFSSFHHHVQGRRRRSKVRTRHYLDAGLCFVEVKLKTTRKVTVKKRLSHDARVLDRLHDAPLRFIEDCHTTQYDRASPGEYQPVLCMQYDRITLVARDGGERMTIDHGLRFWDDRTEEHASPDMLIVETKSRFGRGIADGILRGSGTHPIGSCSKYCVGLAAIGAVSRFNKFMPAFRRLLPHLADAAGRLPQPAFCPIPAATVPAVPALRQAV
jgi:hypothetical protein